MRRLALAAAALALAGCGSPPPDLLAVERSGPDANANVDLVVSDGGSVTCDGHEHALDADRLLTARQLVRDLQPQAELGIELPPGPPDDLSYRVSMEAGTIAFSDRSPGIVPGAFRRVAAFTKDVTERVCVIEREGRSMPDLIAAVKAGDAPAVERMLARDPELADTVEDGIPAVRLALYHRQPAVLEALLAAVPQLDGLDHAALGWAEDLRRDIAADPELVRRRSADGFTALHYACFFGGADATAVLLEAGADPDAEADNPMRVRPLHSAAAARDAESARLLLAAGADPDARQNGGYTALHAAAQHDDDALAGLLLRNGADPSLRDDKGADAAAMARASEAVAVLALLGAPTA